MNNFKKNIYRTVEDTETPLPTYTAFSMSNSSDDLTPGDACTNQSGLEITRYHSGELPDPIVGDIIFNDINGLFPFNGNAEFWKFDSDGVGMSAMKISTIGVVIQIDVCA